MSEFSRDFEPRLRREPALPPGMAERLRRIPSEEIREACDDTLDHWLVDLPVPSGLQARCRALALPRRRWPRRQLLVAASWLLLIGLSWLGSAAAYLASIGVTLTEGKSSSGASILATLPWDEAVADQSEAPLLFSADRSLAAALGPDADGFLPTEGRAVDMAPLVAQLPALDSPTEDSSPSPPSTNRQNGIAQLPSGPELLAPISRFPRFAYYAQTEAASPRALSGDVRGRGVTPPNLGAYRVWQQATGVHPEVVPSERGLNKTTVPLSVDSSAFNQAEQSVQSGKLPPPAAVRVEDFIAATTPETVSLVADRLGLRIIGGPSPLGSGETRLLHVVVPTPRLPAAARQPVHLVIAVDASAAMLEENRSDDVRRALAKLPAWLGAHDRLSLVAFGSRGEVLLSGAPRDNSPAWQAALARWSPAGSAELLTGLREACFLGEVGPLAPLAAIPKNSARKVVILSHGGPAYDRSTRTRITEALQETAAAGVELHVIDLSRRNTIDSQLLEFSAAARGTFHRAESPEALQAALVAALTGQLQTLATEAALEVTFDPQSVATYRLLGHEATPLAGQWRPAAGTTTLYAGHSPSGLFEVRLWPNTQETVARALLTWRDPHTGQRQELQSTFRRGDFAESFASSPPALQVAAVAAGTADALRQSPFLTGRGWADLRRMVNEINPEYHADPGVRRLLQFIDAAQEIKGR